ncbi:hypothetical protein NKJ50_33230 [Mesorhizobium sp. M0115]|uniref:hypothetical protein n=1 Tax=Mesorhizobium sp. M0115 TaxID=2956883 RepID=UPI00333D48DC
MDTGAPALACRQSFENPAQQIVFQEKIDAIEDAVQRLRRLHEQLSAVVPTWFMARVVELIRRCAVPRSWSQGSSRPRSGMCAASIRRRS